MRLLDINLGTDRHSALLHVALGFNLGDLIAEYALVGAESQWIPIEAPQER